ncbi:MAG: methylmalonyl-CoA mutase family protein [Deferrisomatales bacterium]|nr:methylmalonyl-CoA mutase family protein [Deferrisomatales bacterium]
MDVARYIKDDKDAVQDVILSSGIHVKARYGPEDLEAAGFDYATDLGDPGQYPFTRNIFPEGYRSRAWTTRQYTGFGTPRETNERFKLMIDHGQTGLNVAFDLPTQMGYDSDHEMAHGEVGRVGMAVDSLRDFEVAFAGIDLHKVGAGLTINAVASIMLAMYEATAEKLGFDRAKISATPQNDILKEVIGRGAWIYALEPAIKLIGDTIEYSIEAMPRTNPVSVCGYHIRESGATPAQEMAYAFLIANAYIDEVVRRGYAPDQFVGRFSFNLNIFGNLWEQVAKFRAGRKVWAHNLVEKYQVKDPRNLWLRGLFAGGGSGLTKAEPENNIVRGAYYGLAAALSGAQTTALCSFDEAFTIPTPRSALLSLRTCQLLMEEVGMRDTVDPLAGSYFVETLTKQMEEKIREEMEEVERQGGIVEGIRTGFIQKKLARQAFEFEAAVQKGELVKVGVNKYVTEEEQEVELHEYNEAWAEEQIAGLKELRMTRNARPVAESLGTLERVAREGGNTMFPLVECCKAYATVGEMSDVFLQVFGAFDEPGIF